ncbi:hypothetical protein GF377_04880 [candidate division GN15 bacterium]|nr:hypothetical protein [candidate division GN15 bacterium]
MKTRNPNHQNTQPARLSMTLAVCLLAVIGLPLISATGQTDDLLPDRKISLELEGVPIASVLNMIASQNGLNLVLSSEVDGNVTMRLDNVDVRTALDAVLTANGYNYFLKDDIIVVKLATTDAAGELSSRIIRLKYLAPNTAQKALESRLSKKGKVIVLDRAAQGAMDVAGYQANRLMITDYPNILDDLERLVAEMDVPERSVQIEARIIETTIDASSNLGFTWPTAISSKLADADDGGSSDPGTSTETTSETSGAGVYDPNAGTWTWGKLSVGELNTVLHLLKQNGNSKLVSDPRITTLENHEAVFKFTTIIPIQTINRFTEGAATTDIVTFEDEEVGISLRVTPRINDNDRITLDVEPTVEDIIGYNGPPENQKPITASRSIQTRVTVQDGETVALGGLLKESDIETVQKVPLLGHIPLLGSLLFTNKSTETTTTDLIILITPRIIE